MAAGHRMSWLGGLLLAAVVIATAALLFPGTKRPDSAPPPPATSMVITNPGVPVAAEQPGFSRLVGKWLRLDGDYVLEVRLVASDGKMEADYFNPNPIHVSRAEASRDGSVLKVFVELRDANYPGCTYSLRYNAEKDSMEGVYYQAALQESYDVAFVRMPAEAQ
jgi:hypothetical protein